MVKVPRICYISGNALPGAQDGTPSYPLLKGVFMRMLVRISFVPLVFAIFASVFLSFGTAEAATTHFRHYTVKSGDTLSEISLKLYGDPNWWPELLWANRHKIADPNLILVGQRLQIRHKWHWQPSVPWRWRVQVSDTAKVGSQTSPSSSPSHSGPSGGSCDSLSGTLDYAQLEQLWECVGGSSGTAAVAACIAEHESGGNQSATGPFGEEGYWQINPVNNGNVVNGVTIEASYDPTTNARDAVAMSGNGTNWSPWTTAPDCGV